MRRPSSCTHELGGEATVGPKHPDTLRTVDGLLEVYRDLLRSMDASGRNWVEDSYRITNLNIDASIWENFLDKQYLADW